MFCFPLYFDSYIGQKITTAVILLHERCAKFAKHVCKTYSFRIKTAITISFNFVRFLSVGTLKHLKLILLTFVVHCYWILLLGIVAYKGLKILFFTCLCIILTVFFIFRYVIHTVGPRYNVKYKTAAESALFSSYRNVMKIVRWVTVTV